MASFGVSWMMEATHDAGHVKFYSIQTQAKKRSFY